MTYEEAKTTKAALEAAVAAHAAIMSAFPRGAMNLTPDYVRATPEWQAARAASDSAFRKLQHFNATFVKVFAKEYRADRARRRA